MSYILGLIELERRCAIMNENYAGEMALKLKQINLLSDEQKFSDAFMSAPVAPPLITVCTPMVGNLTPLMTNGIMTGPSQRNNPECFAPVITAATNPTALALPATVIPPADIPRTLSMPPAYESQTSTALAEFAHHGGAVSSQAISNAVVVHQRNLTAEIPSQP